MRDWYMERMMKKMSAEEKKGMMGAMMDKFFETMSREEKIALMSEMMPGIMDRMLEGMSAGERRDLMSAMMPTMMDRILEGLSPGDRVELMAGMMPRMMAQMFGGGEGVADMSVVMNKMMPCMQGKGDADSGDAGGFRPWEFCPCRELCAAGREGAPGKSASDSPASANTETRGPE